MARKKTIEQLRSMRATALARAHRMTSRSQSDPARGSHYRTMARDDSLQQLVGELARSAH
jgi:hypothetical protein